VDLPNPISFFPNLKITPWKIKNDLLNRKNAHAVEAHLFAARQQNAGALKLKYHPQLWKLFRRHGMDAFAQPA